MVFVMHLLSSALLAWALQWPPISGSLLAFVALYLTARAAGLLWSRPARYARRLELGVAFCLWFIGQILLATYHVAGLVLARRVNVAPAVLAYPVARPDTQTTTLLALLLTLTPGTLALDYDEQHGLLYVHALDANQREEVTDLLHQLEHRLLAWLDAGQAQGEQP
jgi:multicomponent Na+:H+ antiporter subunit E